MIRHFFVSFVITTLVLSQVYGLFSVFPNNVENVSAAVGDVGIWTDQNGALLPTTSFANFPFDGLSNEIRNDGIYTYNVGTSDVTVDDAGNYLVLYNIQTTDDSNGRFNMQTRVTVNGSAVEGSHGYGYSRNNNNDEAFANGAALALNLSADDEIAVQWRRDSDAPTNGSIAGISTLHIVRLPDDADASYGHYGTPTQNNFTGQSWTDLAGLDVIRETDTSSIELQAGGSDIRLKNSGSTYLIIYGLPFNTGGSRTQRISRAVSGSTEIEQSSGYFYQRNGSNEFGSLYSIFLYRTNSANEDISIQGQRGLSDVNGSASMMNASGESGVFVMELPSFAETFVSVDGTGGQNLSPPSPTDLNVMRTVDHNDSGSFTKTSDTTMNVEQDMDVLLMSSCRTQRSGTSGSRLTVGARFEIEGIDQTRGSHGMYVRGNQGSQDTYEGTINPAGVYAVSTDDSVQVEAYDGGDNGNNDTTVAGSCGFGALNLDTLVSAGNSVPVASGVSIDGGAASVTLTENTGTTVSCVGTVTDADGFADITSVEADFYRTGVGAGSGLDDNNHYELVGDSECVPSGGSGNTETYTCDFEVWYVAEPTDTGTYAADDWTCVMIPTDNTEAGTGDSDTIEVDTLLALDVTSSIDYGTLDPNTDSGAANQTTTITNTGNANIDPELSGTNMSSGGDTLTVGNQEYSATSFTYGAGTDLTGSATQLDLSLSKPISTTTPVTDDVEWGIGIPDAQPAGTYTGTNTVGAASEL